jgi:hypothetical protein
VRGFLPGAQEQQVEIGLGRQFAAAIATDGDQAEAFALRRVAGAVDVGQGKVPERGDDFIGDPGQRSRGRQPALGVVDTAQDAGATQVPGFFEHLDGATAQVGRIAAGVLERLSQGLTQRAAVDTIGRRGR